MLQAFVRHVCHTQRRMNDTRYSRYGRRSKNIVKFVSYNIQYGIGLDGKYDLDRIAASLQGADVIALQEVTRGFIQNGFVDMVDGLEALFPEFYSAFHAPFDILLDSSVVDGRRRNRRFQFGNMILARYPILSVRALLLPRSRTYDRLNLQRSALETIIDAPGGPLRIYSVHLDHISPDERINQINALKAWISSVPATGAAVTGAVEFGMRDTPTPEEYLAFGDFNLQPGSPEYQVLFGREDVFYGQSLRRENPVDSLRHLAGLSSENFSWQGPEPEQKRMLLDYALAAPCLAPRLKKAWIDTDAEGSDHFPLWVELA